MVHNSADPSPTIVPPPELSQHYQAIGSAIVDYALAVALIGLNPFQSWLVLTLVAVALIIVKMVWDIRQEWNFTGKHSICALVGYGFNLLGALALGFMALLTFVFIGAIFPVVTRFALSAALMTVTWTVGAATNQFFLDGYLNLEGESENGESYV